MRTFLVAVLNRLFKEESRLLQRDINYSKSFISKAVYWKRDEKYQLTNVNERTLCKSNYNFRFTKKCEINTKKKLLMVRWRTDSKAGLRF